MAISLKGFKEYSGFKSEGMKASGTVLFTRRDPSSNNLIKIPKTTINAPQGIFCIKDVVDLTSGMQAVPTMVEALDVGKAYNIPANVKWLQSFTEVLISNPGVFSGGEDSSTSDIVNVRSAPVMWPDSVLQSHLDSGESIVRGLLAFRDDEATPDHSRVDNAIYFISLFLLQNNSTQDFSYSMDLSSVQVNAPHNFKGHFQRNIYRYAINLIAPWRKVRRFMPVDEEVTSA